MRKLAQAWDIQYSVGKIQPHAKAQISGLYMGSKVDCRIPLACTLYADNLSEPLKSDLYVTVNAKKLEISLEMLRDYAHASDGN